MYCLKLLVNFFYKNVFYEFFFFFSSRRRHTRWNCDWSSDVCSSDLVAETLHVNVHELNDAQHPMLGIKGYADDGTCLPLGHLVDALGEPRIGVDVGHNQLFPVLGDPAGDAFAHLEPDVLEGLGCVPHRDGEVKLVVFWSTMSSDQVSGRKYSAIFSMIVCRMESRSSDDVRALATSWKIFSSCTCRFCSAPVASAMQNSV